MNGDEEDIMGYEERKRERDEQEKHMAELRMIDRMIGPVLLHDHYRGLGCPQCAAASGGFIKKWCWGAREDFNGPCATAGGHLHGICAACNFQWKEEGLSAALNRERIVQEVSQPVP